LHTNVLAHDDEPLNPWFDGGDKTKATQRESNGSRDAEPGHLRR
jgi:hypothetical protein